MDRPGYFSVIIYAHHASPLVEGTPSEYSPRTGPRIYRGQIILLSGVTGHHIPHLHFGLAGNSLPGSPEDFMYYDAYGIDFDPAQVGFSVHEFDLVSAWTVRNQPKCAR